MKIKSSRQGMNQKPPDVSSTVTLEVWGGGGLGPSLSSRLLRAQRTGWSLGSGQKKGASGDCALSVLKAVTSEPGPHPAFRLALLSPQGKG